MKNKIRCIEWQIYLQDLNPIEKLLILIKENYQNNKNHAGTQR